MLKIFVTGRPISKSNFKISGTNGKPIMPAKGKYSKYREYEELVSWSSVKAISTSKYKNTKFNENLATVIKLYFPDKRNRDIHNYPKSICDGIEKSGIIKNDKLLKPVIIMDFIDKENPRVEIELYPESEYTFKYSLDEIKK
ncbi:RusA family crossover junction endodeoxyribonuclease [Clostridioides sp. ZZV14-6045]|uniref:RusA family crossover junction endodeoxyribonuclease n=1 Tax=Clostridioides sp. ZZV14-6045 TaxID=2811489 RepID=UPI001D105964|nr:RusA family crossover junction endodeoxyribonuclease [Clostridioides sp. ZZV14-6045]